MSKKNNQHHETSYACPLGLSIGLSLGLVLGAAMGNIALGLSIGASLSLCFGCVIYASNKSDKGDKQE
ncbi:MAG: hypothetical protein ACI4MG_04730 [Aristaeellaceae bacterium]